MPNVELLPEDLQERMAAVDAQLNSALENKDFYDVGMAPYDAQSAFRELRRLWYEFKDNPKVISEKQTSIQASPYRAPIISVLYEAKKCSTKALDGDSDNFQTQVSNHYATKDMTGIRKLARLEAKPYDQRGKDDLDSIKKLRLGL